MPSQCIAWLTAACGLLQSCHRQESSKLQITPLGVEGWELWVLMLILILQCCTFIWLSMLLILARFHCMYLLFISLPFWITPSWVAFPRKGKGPSIPCPASTSSVLIAKTTVTFQLRWFPKVENNFYCFIYLQKLLKTLFTNACFLPAVLCGALRARSSTCVPSRFVILKLAAKFTLALIDVGLEPSSYRPDPDWAETAQPRDCWREQWLILHFNFWDLIFYNYCKLVPLNIQCFDQF